MTAETKRDPRAGINIKIRPELRARKHMRDPRRIDRAGIRARRNRGPLRTVGEIARATDPRLEGRRRHARGRVTRWTCYSY